MSRVLIAGIRSPVAYDLARKFLSAGHIVAVCDCIATNLAQNCGAELRLHSSPVKNYALFSEEAKSIIYSFAPDIVIPMNEEIFYWAKLAKTFDFPLFAPPLKTLMQLHSKYSFIRLCQEIGISVPQTQYFKAESCGFSQKVLKREFSRFGESVYIRPKIKPKLDCNPANRYICQDYIDGSDLCFYAIAQGGEIIVSSCYFSNWRSKNGASYYFAPVNEETAQKAKFICGKIIKHLDINGQISFDLRLTDAGELYLIECNPRATSGLHLINSYPEILCNAFLKGQKMTPAPSPKYILLAMLFYGLPKAITEGKFADWKKELCAGEDVLKGKNIYALFDMIVFQLKALFKGQTLAQYLTHDIECNRDLEHDE